MSESFDVVIVGSGPAGVSAAFPLVNAGLQVMMVDGGRGAGDVRTLERDFLHQRAEDEQQWEWMVGKGYHALSMRDAISPKLRVPMHAHVFSGFLQENQVDTEDFMALGSLAPGGLSNAWGCGVAQLTGLGLVAYPCDHDDLALSYRNVIERIGVSGPEHDDLADYFGLDAELQPAIKLDALHTRLYRKYVGKRSKLAAEGFRLGRFPVAALSQNRGERKGCNRSGNCLFGCERRSLYSATEDLAVLRGFDNFHYSSLQVEEIHRDNGLWHVRGKDPCVGNVRVISAHQIYLAAGTIATTRLALNALKLDKPVPLLSCPTAAFLLWMPRFLGARREEAFGYGQLAFVQAMREDVNVLGSTFSTVGLPMTEFARHLPLRRRYAIDILRGLMSSCVVGNLFLPGHLSKNMAQRSADGRLRITGGHREDVFDILEQAAQGLRKAYAALGAYMLPKSFTLGKPGGDIHYAGTLPMKAQPQRGETSAAGELVGLDGVFVVDGASLPSLSEKPHTLTIMANADRIARGAASRFARRPSL